MTSKTICNTMQYSNYFKFEIFTFVISVITLCIILSKEAFG